MSVEADYHGREQTLVKHLVLRRYLKKMAHIIGYYKTTLNYIDCFSGPWEAKSANLADTSFNIAISELKMAREHLADHGKKLRLYFYFVEKDTVACSRLEEFVRPVRDSDTILEVKNSAIENCVEDIVRFCQESGPSTFTFIFIDPTGWGGVPMQRLAPLLRINHGEILINFMTADIKRFVAVDSQKRAFDSFFGTPDFRNAITGESVHDREDSLVKVFMDRIRLCGGFKYVCPAIVLHPQQDRTRFHLIYGTRHPKGVEVFKDVEQHSMADMERIRANVQEREQTARTGTPLLFPEALMQQSQYYESLRMRYLGMAKAAVEISLRQEGPVQYHTVWEVALSFPLTWESDLRAWISSWEKSGQVEVLGLGARERTLKREKNHRLRWI